MGYVFQDGRLFPHLSVRGNLTYGYPLVATANRYVDPPEDWKLKLSGWRYRKTPYDTQMRRKPLWAAMTQAFQGRRISY